MVEHCSDGSTIWPSIARLAAYSKLSERKVQRLIHGEDRRGHHIPGLCDRGILSKLASGNAGKRRPATYRLNEDALEEDPRVTSYLTRQQRLPEIPRPAIPGEPIRGRELVSSGHQSGVTGTPDSKAVDPSTNPKPLTHHADGALGLPAWLAIKELLRNELTPSEWELWVRPARLLRVMDCKTMLIALPPNGRIQAAAVARRQLLNELAGRAGFRAVLTTYPDEWQHEQLKERFGIELSARTSLR
jgi:hypothetical protein